MPNSFTTLEDLEKERSDLKLSRGLRSAPLPIPERNLSVLIVDDSLGDVELASMHLRERCALLECRHSIRDAKEFLKTNPVDVIILDVNMAEEEGIGGLRQMSDASPEAAILVLAGNEDESVALSFIIGGAQDYLIKTAENLKHIYRRVRYVREKKDKEERLGRLAYFDQLTGVANRTALNERMTQLISKGECFSVLFCDLDSFKRINDTLGHDAGDDLLRQVAQRLQSCTRYEDTVFRYGGDEFVVIIEDQDQGSEQDVVSAMCKRISEVMEIPFYMRDTPLHVTISVGAANHPLHGTSVSSLLKKSDSAMYYSKGTMYDSLRASAN